MKIEEMRQGVDSFTEDKIDYYEIFTEDMDKLLKVAEAAKQLITNSKESWMVSSERLEQALKELET